MGGTPAPTDELTEVGWFAPDAMPELAFEADQHIIARYFEAPFAGAPVDPRFVLGTR
jgi:8-oxo-dGTP diphosphatase